jgi:hypothetical protein
MKVSDFALTDSDCEGDDDPDGFVCEAVAFGVNVGGGVRDRLLVSVRQGETESDDVCECDNVTVRDEDISLENDPIDREADRDGVGVAVRVKDVEFVLLLDCVPIPESLSVCDRITAVDDVVRVGEGVKDSDRESAMIETDEDGVSDKEWVGVFERTIAEMLSDTDDVGVADGVSLWWVCD